MTIGESLGAARRRMGLSVEGLGARIRIRDHIIEAIERDEFGECGGAFYARGHIRSLARFLDVDEEPLVEEFNAEHAETVGHSVTEIFATKSGATAGERPRVRWMLLMAAACVVGAGAVAGYGYWNDDSSEAHTASTVIGSADDSDRSDDSGNERSTSEEPREHTSGDRSPEESDEEDTDDGSDDADDDADADADADADEDVTLRIRAEERTWLSVTDSSGTDLFTGIMLNGDERDWADAEELKLVVGNTNGVTMEVNDTEHDAVSGSGGVAHLILTPEGVE